MSTIPLFRRIADELREAILDGHLAPGDQVPSESDLTARYATTRSTVRKAIALLRAEGRIFSSQGSRSYVCSRPALLMVSTGSQWRSRRDEGVTSLNAGQGNAVEQNLLEVTEADPPADVAALLGLAADERVIVRRYGVLIGIDLIQLRTAYYPIALFAATAVAEPRRIQGGALALFEDELGGHVARFVERLSIRMPTPQESVTLRLSAGVPMVRTVRAAYDASGHVVEVMDSTAPGDVCTFEYVIDVPPPAERS
ncbi:GntR family transcriptional regulator [Planobispora siamensis]|uniref:GntR family transcriptional regulator n=1 Tax=Planobispora siamensis TaxID=936338 RepID=A0A8J3WMV3_9ACTN|nr:GntR family transcriptional regulator [Planobispora siamensis]GIH95373.1 GntR family transcriptional regulator [Planobispora siamensis]